MSLNTVSVWCNYCMTDTLWHSSCVCKPRGLRGIHSMHTIWWSHCRRHGGALSLLISATAPHALMKHHSVPWPPAAPPSPPATAHTTLTSHTDMWCGVRRKALLRICRTRCGSGPFVWRVSDRRGGRGSTSLVYDICGGVVLISCRSDGRRVTKATGLSVRWLRHSRAITRIWLFINVWKCLETTQSRVLGGGFGKRIPFFVSRLYLQIKSCVNIEVEVK